MTNRARHLRTFVLSLPLVLGSVVVGCTAEPESPPPAPAEQQARLVKVGPGSLWRTATHKALPSYPPESLRNGVGGVAVAEVRVSVSGDAESITVLEAPDDHIAEAVKQAVGDWSFAAPRIAGSDEDTRALGKLVFYFVAETGKVSNATALKSEEPSDASSGTAEGSARTVSEEELRQLIVAENWVALDIRTRAEHRNAPYGYAATNIPFDELQSRAPGEVSWASGLGVSCRDIYRYMCVAAANQLLRMGYGSVVLSMEGVLEGQ